MKLRKIKTKINNKMSDVSINMNLYEEAYESNQDSVKTSNNDSKNTPIRARTLELMFEKRKMSSSGDVIQPSSKDPNISEDETEAAPPTTVVPPSTSKDPTKTVKNPTKKVRKNKPKNPKPANTPILVFKSHQPTTSTPPPASKQVAKVTDVDHLADLAYNISTVIGPRYTAEYDDILTLSSLKLENKI